MLWLKKSFFFAAVFCSSLVWVYAIACTEITLKATDGTVLVARTLEFGPSLNTHIRTSPQGRIFATTMPNGQAGKSWQNKYGYLYMDFFGQHHPVDGLNEKGLSFGYLYLPGYTDYQRVPLGKEEGAVSYLEFGDWVLGNFQTVAEVKKAIKSIYVFAQPLTTGFYKNKIFPLHAKVTDTFGNSLTIEFIKGKMHVYENAQGVMTNSPSFPWQLTNLKNYVSLTPYAPMPVTVAGMVYSATGQGAGSVGLPGDYSPPSRFVKMAFLLKTAFPVPDGVGALSLAGHILNNVDIPYGAVRGTRGTTEPADTTQWTVFKDLKKHVLYFKSYNNSTLKAIELDNLDFNKGAATLSMPITGEQVVVDVTAKYKKKQTSP